MSTIPEEELRAQAAKRAKERRDFPTHLVAYAVINAVFVAIWALTGMGTFWPGFILAGWGVGVLLHAWSVYFQRPATEADVQREMERLRRA